jgi:putative membrane protein
MNQTRWKILSYLALSLGLGVIVWLVSAASLTAVVQSLLRIGWGALAVVAVRAVMIVTNGAAWSRLLRQLTTVPTRVFLLARWIREAVDVLLPVAYVGGGLIGARILTFWRMPSAIAVASAAADLFLQIVAQALFAAFGATLLMRLIGTRNVLPDAIVGIAAAVIAIGGFYIVQRHGGARVLDRLFALLSWRVASRAQAAEPGFQRAVDAIWNGRQFDIVIALLVHALAWTFGTFEVWFALRFMEWPVTFEQAIILESLGASISIAGFLIPGSLGVQEAGYVLIGQLLGLPIQFSLSLSLVKRIPDLLLGLPGLLTWHTLETHHLLLRRGAGLPQEAGRNGGGELEASSSLISSEK